ncbi:vWA domain-containing protein [Sorangium sp. So ce1151]|uniref:vWA domain-containing protein n=1 Tax=Sorangium sp. So ce1151 TaxID=3133332 RepID=UPI003F5E11AE
MSQTTTTQSSSAEELDLVFWDTSAYKWAGSGDWNQWRYIPDGLGGEIGIRFGVSSGSGTFDWNKGGVPPFGSVNDGIGAASFGKNEQAGMSSTSVNAVRMQGTKEFTHAQNNFTVELDFSRYKGSKVGGKDGVAGANTFIGLSDFYAGLTFARTTVTVTGTLADGSAASPAGWKLVNGGAAPPSKASIDPPSAEMSLVNGVLQGTNKSAPGGIAKPINCVMGLMRLDAAGYRTLHLRYDIFPVAGNWGPRIDNSGLYVASAFPRKPAQPPEPAKPPPVDLVVVIDTSVSMKDEADALSQTIEAAIAAAKTKCPSDLRVTYLGIEGTFKKTRFDTTVRDYLTQTAKVDASSLRGRTNANSASLTEEQKKIFDPREDGARAIEDVANHFDWRPGASRSVFFLGDEALEGGVSVTGQDQEDIDAATRAIEAAKKTGTRVHTYLGTSKFSSDARKHERIVKEIQAEFARVAQQTGGKPFTSTDAQNGFQALLEEVICGSNPSATTTP